MLALKFFLNLTMMCWIGVFGGGGVAHLLKHILLLALKIVLGQIAVLAEAVRVVRLGGVAAGRRLLLLAFVVVAVVAHVFGVMLFLRMRTNKKLLKLSRVKCHRVQALQKLVLLAE